MINHSAEPEIQKHLQETRSVRQKEMAAALKCRTPAQKRALVRKWQQTYPESTVQQLLTLARNKDVALVVAKWNVENWL